MARPARSKRASAPPRGDGRESIEVHTSDGWRLRADVREPPRKSLAGVAVLAHAMFARKTEFERPAGSGLAAFLVERGWRTIAFDFRGHGDSGPRVEEGGRWTYDDLVTRDLPAIVDCARARARKLPVVIFGHSLGGHVAIAAQGIGAMHVDAIVCGGANLWLRRFEPSVARWAVKRAAMAAMEAICARRGFFPARALRLGSDDEAAGYFLALARYTRTNAWTSDDGAHDYAAAAARVSVPVAQIASEGDLLNCQPDCGARFLDLVGGPKEMIRVRAADDGGRAPGHMALVTSAAARSAWARAAEWVRGAV